jgi:peptide/nickel transport system permease protein
VDPSFSSAIAHLTLPVLVLAFYFAARWARTLRASLLGVLELDFIRGARARGLSERQVLLRHALPNALLPLIGVVGQSLPALFSGSLIVERVFDVPGMGLLIFESIEGNDYLVAITACLIFAALTMFSTLLQDVLLALIDPRVRSGVSGAAPLEAGEDLV